MSSKLGCRQQILFWLDAIDDELGIAEEALEDNHKRLDFELARAQIKLKDAWHGCNVFGGTCQSFHPFSFRVNSEFRLHENV